MKVMVISKKGFRAEIVVQNEATVKGKVKLTSETRHLVYESSDGKYHWRKKNAKGEVVQHETYSL